jgi:hypothetical protein
MAPVACQVATMSLPALSPPFTSWYFPESSAAGRYTSKLKLFGCLLNPTHEKQNDKDDQDDADEPDATVTIPVPIAAEAATRSDDLFKIAHGATLAAKKSYGRLEKIRASRSRTNKIPSMPYDSAQRRRRRRVAGLRGLFQDILRLIAELRTQRRRGCSMSCVQEQPTGELVKSATREGIPAAIADRIG